jgi:hypothetical protein
VDRGSFADIIVSQQDGGKGNTAEKEVLVQHQASMSLNEESHLMDDEEYNQ